MQAKIHVPVGFLTCLAVYVYTYYYYWNGDTFALVFFSLIGSLFPDLDQIFNRHRDFFTHTFIVPIVVVAYVLIITPWRYYDAFFFTLAIGLHLLFDLHFNPGKWKGTYCIVKPGFVMRKSKKTKKEEISYDRMSGKNSTITLAVSSAVCFVACILLYSLF